MALQTWDQSRPDANERRRYALLQAAATLLPTYTANADMPMLAAVNHAEALLEEIERREKAANQ